jgi:acetyl-CoA carboxylase carboxyltransferase component
MGPEGAANIILKNEIDNASDPDTVRREKVAEYRNKFANPYTAASSGYCGRRLSYREKQENASFLHY